MSSYFKEMFLTPGLYISILLVVVLTLFSCKYEGHGGTVNDCIALFVSGNFTKTVACIPAALPVIVTFCDDCKHQYLRPIVTRCGVKKYTRAKFLASCVSSYLVLAIGIIIAMLILSIYTPITCDPTFSEFGYGPYAAFETMGLPALTFITRACIFSAYAAVYTLVGLVVAALIPNKFLVFAVPFASSFLFQEMSFPLYGVIPDCFNIASLQLGIEIFEGKGMLFNAVYSILIPVIIASALYLLFNYLVEKRVRCELD